MAKVEDLEYFLLNLETGQIVPKSWIDNPNIDWIECIGTDGEDVANRMTFLRARKGSTLPEEFEVVSSLFKIAYRWEEVAYQHGMLWRHTTPLQRLCFLESHCQDCYNVDLILVRAAKEYADAIQDSIRKNIGLPKKRKTKIVARVEPATLELPPRKRNNGASHQGIQTPRYFWNVDHLGQGGAFSKQIFEAIDESFDGELDYRCALECALDVQVDGYVYENIDRLDPDLLIAYKELDAINKQFKAVHSPRFASFAPRSVSARSLT
jgi:hypothetical protein